MPQYHITDPHTGHSVTLTGDSPPTEAELNDIFAKMPGAAPAAEPSTLQKIWHFANEALPAAGGIIGSIAGGPIGSAIGGAAGQGYKTLTANLGELAPALKDVATNLIAHPRETLSGFVEGAAQGAKDAGIQGAVQAASTLAGNAVGAGMKWAAPRLMQSAVKPTLSALKEYGTTAPKIVQTLLDNGVNVSKGGVAKLQGLLEMTNAEIRSAVQGASGTIDKKLVAARALQTAQRTAQQVNPAADLRAVGKTVQGFMDHPTMTGPTLTIAEAQAAKVGTYQQIGKKFGEQSAAATETQKALARGLKEEIAAKVPGISALNQKDSDLMAALSATERRVALHGNSNPIGFAAVAHSPIGFLASLIDKQPAIKSMLANGFYKSAAIAGKVSEQAIRLAVSTIASADDSQPTRKQGQE